MTAVGLLAYALLLGCQAAPLLRQARWVDRAPWLGIAGWQALSASMVLAAALAAAVLTVPTVPVSSDLAALLHACVHALRAQYATPGGALLSSAGGLLALLLVVRAGGCMACELAAGWRQRRTQLSLLNLVGRSDRALGAVVVDHPAALAYCLPGARAGRIVVTSAAMAVLDPAQLGAVLAHERAHLRGRHHLVLAGTRGLARAFPFVPTFQLAHAQVARLLELLADDHATRRCDRVAVAGALLALAEDAAPAPAPAATLAAGGPTALARARRLLQPATPLGRFQRSAGLALIGAILAVPLLLAAAPSVAAIRLPYCPVDLIMPLA